MLLATVVPALAAAAAAAVFLLWRRRQRVAASDVLLGKLGACAMEDGGAAGTSPRSLRSRSRSLRAPLRSLADSLASEARRAAARAAPTGPATPAHGSHCLHCIVSGWLSWISAPCIAYEYVLRDCIQTFSNNGAEEQYFRVKRGKTIGRNDEPMLPFSDWRIEPEEIEVDRRPDGSLWRLGGGGFGDVRA